MLRLKSSFLIVSCLLHALISRAEITLGLLRCFCGGAVQALFLAFTVWDKNCTQTGADYLQYNTKALQNMGRSSCFRLLLASHLILQTVFFVPSLPADVLWGSFVTHSFLPHVCGEATLSHVGNGHLFLAQSTDSNRQADSPLLTVCCSKLFLFESEKIVYVRRIKNRK